MINAIFASDLAGGFGLKGGLPWPPIPEDLKHFKETTMNCNTIMGYNTWKTLPKLKGRTPMVALRPTKDPELQKFMLTEGNPFVRLDQLAKDLKCYDMLCETPVFVIGGAKLITPEVLEICESIYHTTVKGVYEADTFISKDVMFHLSQRPHSVLLETDKCIIREYYS